MAKEDNKNDVSKNIQNGVGGVSLSKQAHDRLKNANKAPGNVFGKSKPEQNTASFSKGNGAKDSSNSNILKDNANRNTSGGNDIAQSTEKGLNNAVSEAGKEAGKKAGRGAAAAATGGASETVNAPLETIQKAVKKGEEAKKKANKEEKSNRKVSLVRILIAGIFLFILLFMGIIAAVNPINIIKTIGSKADKKIESLIDEIKDFFDGSSEEEEELFRNVTDYASAISVYTELISEHLDDALEFRKSQIKDNLKFTIGEETYVADYELTLAQFEAQGDPFASANYGALLAGYATSDYDVNESTFKRFEEKMKNGYEDMLKVTYTYTDENGNPFINRQVIPLPIYKYNSKVVEMAKERYISYLKLLMEGHDELTKADIESLTKDISDYKKKKKELEKKYEKEGDKEKKKEIQKKIDDLNQKIKEANDLIEKLKNGQLKSSYKYIKESNFNNTTHEVTLYSIATDKDGDPIVDHYVTDEAGEEGDIMVLFNDGLYGSYYVLSGRGINKPEVKEDYYAKITLNPFNETDVFEIFDIDPAATYPLSEGDENAITNEEMYNNYYDVLKEETDLCNYGAGNSNHVCSLTEEQIKEYLENIKDASGNRRQLVKTALTLTGAIYYEWGGKPTNPGWNDRWWQPKANGYTGLDCSGYIKWIYWTAWGEGYENLNGTAGISSSCKAISKKELLPGDLGVKFIGGSSSSGTNHVGMYMGKDKNGNELWIHCTGGDKRTVVISENYKGFHYYLRVNSAALEGDNHWTDTIDLPFGSVENEDEMYVIAACMLQEYGGVDAGRTAVAEAMCNYLKLKNYPSNQHNLYLLTSNQIHKNYLESYKQMFQTHTVQPKVPSQNDYNIILKALSGTREQITNSNVAYWRGKNSSIPSNGIFYKQIPASDGNKFFSYQ